MPKPAHINPGIVFFVYWDPLFNSSILFIPSLKLIVLATSQVLPLDDCFKTLRNNSDC